MKIRKWWWDEKNDGRKIGCGWCLVKAGCSWLYNPTNCYVGVLIIDGVLLPVLLWLFWDRWCSWFYCYGNDGSAAWCIVVMVYCWGVLLVCGNFFECVLGGVVGSWAVEFCRNVVKSWAEVCRVVVKVFWRRVKCFDAVLRYGETGWCVLHLSFQNYEHTRCELSFGVLIQSIVGAILNHPTVPHTMSPFPPLHTSLISNSTSSALIFQSFFNASKIRC